MRMTFKVTIVGGLIVFLAVVIVAVFLPTLIWNPPQTTVAHAYTPQEERGRELFYSNGCNYCHTQYVRLEDTGMGAVSEGGDYVFDSPVILGSERTGPDLSYVGRKRSEQWEIDHAKDPRKYSPLSIMPSFEFLPEQDLEDIVAYLFALGNRVAAERMILPPEPYAGNADPLSYPTITMTPQDQGWSTWEAAGLQEGKELYVDMCMTCHGCAGNGLGSYAGTMVVTPADFGQEPFRSMPDDQWFWHVSEGVQGTLMPTWKASLTEEERWSVIRYVQQTFARPVMRDPAEGDVPTEYANLTNPVELTIETLDEGKHIFIRECMVCHGDSGRGDGPYGEGLQPSPPDFGDGSYGDFTDADYFWRISEGLPWSAMPTWKLQYSEEDRWKLVHYVRAIFTQTEEKPPAPEEGQDFLYPDVYHAQTYPEGVSYERGRDLFLTTCAHCHGLAGNGQGWDGLYLDPQPADFREMGSIEMTPELQGEHLAKVTFGIQDTAMPSWGEFLPEDQRWDVIKYLMDTFMVGKPLESSGYVPGQVAADFVTLSKDNWTGEGHVISAENGGTLYQTYCSSCHGATGEGGGPGTVDSASGGPAAYPNNMEEPYILWRVWDGVPDSTMFAFHWLLSESEIWDITAYIETFTSQQGGGQ
jgi:mono/diheme cytochrome c family protein